MKNTMLEMSRYAALARQAVAEGIVLLKNEAVLPLASGGRAALFGYAQFHYYQSGTGSGGLVNTAHVPNLPEVLGGPGGYQLDAEVQARYAAWLAEHPYEMGTGWAQEPWFQPEMPLDEDFVRAAAQRAETAFIVIGRTAGEDQDNSNTPGSFLLTEGEENMLALVCRHFKKSVVLLNVGNIIDMQWVMRYNPGAVAYIWQGGQEGCRGVLDVLNVPSTPAANCPIPSPAPRQIIRRLTITGRMTATSMPKIFTSATAILKRLHRKRCFIPLALAFPIQNLKFGC